MGKIDPQVYFSGCFGVIHDRDCDVGTVRLKASSAQANYLRDLPLHPSQKEMERNDDYSVFELRVRPTCDFQQEILWHGNTVEVLEPLWLRKEMAGIIERMWDKYQND